MCRRNVCPLQVWFCVQDEARVSTWVATHVDSQTGDASFSEPMTEDELKYACQQVERSLSSAVDQAEIECDLHVKSSPVLSLHLGTLDLQCWRPETRALLFYLVACVPTSSAALSSVAAALHAAHALQVCRTCSLAPTDDTIDADAQMQALHNNALAHSQQHWQPLMDAAYAMVRCAALRYATAHACGTQPCAAHMCMGAW